MRQYNRLNDDEDEDETPNQNKPRPYVQYDSTHTICHSHVYINQPIGHPYEYTDLIHRITYAAPDDVFFIHINTPGGNLETGVQMINAMQNSPATIVTLLESTTRSLGTLIFLAGDQMVVNDNCMMMFHDFSTTIGGKGGEIVSHIGATVKWFSAIAKKIYTPFLTDDELTRIFKGEDLWVMTHDIRKRLDRMCKADAPTKQRKQPKVTTEVLS